MPHPRPPPPGSCFRSLCSSSSSRKTPSPPHLISSERLSRRKSRFILVSSHQLATHRTETNAHAHPAHQHITFALRTGASFVEICAHFTLPSGPPLLARPAPFFFGFCANGPLF